MTARSARMLVYHAKDGWRWRLKAQNGNIIADSGQAYVRQRNALDAARMVAKVGIVLDLDGKRETLR